jgi:hypothetical protein
MWGIAIFLMCACLSVAMWGLEAMAGAMFVSAVLLAIEAERRGKR